MKRRAVSVAVLVFLVIWLLPSAALGAPSAEILAEQTASGFRITAVSPSDTAAELIALVCDAKTGAGKKLLRRELTLSAGEQSSPLDVDCDAKTEYVKAFLWEGLGTLRPLAPAREFRYQKPQPEALALSERNVWSTDRQDDCGVGNLFDGSAATFMAGEAFAEKPVVITARLNRVYELSELRLGFAKYENRVYRFSAEASLNGEDYEEILPAAYSDAETDAPLSFPVEGRAKFVRVKIYGHGGNDAGWIRVNHLSLYGNAADDSREIFMDEDFEGSSGRLPANSGDSRWYARAMDEEMYKDYTPALGDDLYADYAAAPEAAAMGTALHIHDATDRTGNTDGFGSAAAFRALTLPEGGADYALSFKLFIPADSENVNWSGFSLLSRPVSGGADLSPAAAVQLRLQPTDGGRVAVKAVNSVQFNETEGGNLTDCFNEAFSLGRTWSVTVGVSPSRRQAEITIDDGRVSESRVLGFAYADVERVNNTPWTNSSVRYLCVNSGAGGKADIYLDSLKVYRDLDGDEDLGEKTVYSENFESGKSLSDMNITVHAVKSNGNGNDASIGASLQTTVDASNTFGGHVMKLTDKTGSDGLLTAIPLTVPDNGNKYIIKWRMREFDPNNYSGFSLASGSPVSFDDAAHPYAIQLRYNLQDGSDGGGDGIQLYRYGSVRMNMGSYGLFAAGGGNRLPKNAEWNVELTVNPLAKSTELRIVSGSRTVTASAAFATADADGKTVEDWSGALPDTLVFHTGAGATADCIIDDIEVIDTGVRENPASDPTYGIVRLEAQWGKGKYVTQNGWNAPTAAADADPNRTRFVERAGLIGEGVSLESVTNPGSYLCAEETDDQGHAYILTLKPYEDTAQFRAFASFNKSKAENTGDFAGATVAYSPVWDASRQLCYTNNSADPLSIRALKTGDYTLSPLFYLRSEAVNFVSDNFKALSLDSRWWTNYPWRANNPTNDSYNFSALIDHRNVIVDNGELFLKATKDDSWPKDLSGETGINYNNDYGKKWERFKGRVGVVSSKNVFYRHSLISGSFKQPDSPIGYWNAFWLRNSSGDWNRETDIFEYLSSHGDSTWYTAVHRRDNNVEKGYGEWRNVGVNVRTGYHEFTLDWGYNYMKFYVDGRLYAGGGNSIAAETIDRQNEGLQLILNTGIGGWEAEPDSTMVWNDGMRVKWIRSFRY